MKRFTSIRFLLMLAFGLSLLIPVVVILLYGHLITSRVLANRALERQQHIVTLQAQHIEQSLEQVREDERYLVSLRSFRRMQTDATAIAEAEQDLIVFAAANPMYFRMLYISADNPSIGIDNSTSTPRIIATDVMQSPPYQDYLEQLSSLQTTQLAVAFDIVWDVPVLRYSLRLDNGVLVMEVLASWVLRNMPGVEANAIWAILNSNGHHLLFPLDSESFADAIPATDAAVQAYLPYFQSSENSAFNAQANTFIYSRIYPTNDRQSYWLLYRQIPQSELYAAVNDFYRTSFGILVGATLIVLGLGMFMGEQIIRPLLALQRQVGDFARGLPLSTAPKSLRLTELNELQQSFHNMAGQLENERRQNRTLIKKLISAQEDERKRIAYDLHDGLIQQLVGAKMYLAMLKTNGDEAHAANIEHGEQALTQAIIEGRRMIEGLHPTILDDLGLVDAIAEHAQQQAKLYDWTLDLQLETLPYTPDKTVAVTIFRIVQEALNNVAKHASASRVRIHLSNGNKVHLSIEDNGTGFDTQQTNGRNSLGLSTMQERATLLSGTCRIESTLDKGTTVTIELPYE
jgi:signal transduction histidine kinase